MMKTILQNVFTVCIIITSCQAAFAQIDLECDGRDMHSVYLIGGGGYYRIDSVDTNPTNPVFLTSNPTGSYGISINNDLSTASGALTVYSCTNIYYYWDGIGWTNTGHSTGSFSNVNPGGSADYIFNLADNGTTVSRYDGSPTPVTVLSNLGSFSDFIHDVAVDNLGNFYLFFTNTQKIVSYTSNGIPIDTLSTSGFPAGSNCGLAILGDRIYATTCSGAYELYEGIKTGSNINFTMILNFGIQSADIAACPNAASPLSTFENPDAPHFAVYPNPAADVAEIKLYNTSEVRIFDCTGALVMTIPTHGLSGYQLNVSEWTSGLYFISAVSEKMTTTTGKFIVE